MPILALRESQQHKNGAFFLQYTNLAFFQEGEGGGGFGTQES